MREEEPAAREERGRGLLAVARKEGGRGALTVAANVAIALVGSSGARGLDVGALQAMAASPGRDPHGGSLRVLANSNPETEAFRDNVTLTTAS